MSFGDGSRSEAAVKRVPGARWLRYVADNRRGRRLEDAQGVNMACQSAPVRWSGSEYRKCQNIGQGGSEAFFATRFFYPSRSRCICHPSWMVISNTAVPAVADGRDQPTELLSGPGKMETFSTRSFNLDRSVFSDCTASAIST